ncbi:MAG TPA: tetratricopeptide repeat protein [Gemmataceae bacterium]
MGRFSRVFSWRRIRWLALALVVAGLSAPHVWAWYHLRAAKAALAKYDPKTARALLQSCERVWGQRPSVHLLASRAAWQSGNAEAAVTELREAQRLSGGATDDTAFEWALIQASAANVREVEEYLQRRADRFPAVAPLIWESLALGYLRVYRNPDAMVCLLAWLKNDPDNVRALELRGATYVAGQGAVLAVNDFRRVLELDPTRTDARWRFIDASITLGKYEDAAGQLELFARDQPNEPAVAVRLARCYIMVSREADARRLMDDVIAKRPDEGVCWRTLAQIELAAGRLPEAEQAIRKAADMLPNDYQAQQLYFQVLQQQGKTEDAKRQMKVAEAARDRVERLRELTGRRLGESPLDPALHYEMGKMLLDTGRAESGEKWLLTALSVDPDHRPSHEALAAYYASRGDKEKAELHRGRAAPKE